jgi:drug/metabolite transporter (DMT)-like permease
MQNQHLLGFVLVCCAGLMWSFGAPIIRSLDHVELYRYQYLISRMFAAVPIILLYILYRDRRNVLKNMKRINRFTLLGALCLALSSIGWIYALTITSVAVPMLMFATAPLLSGILGYFLLGEMLSRTTIMNTTLVIVGVLIMVIGAVDENIALGAFLGFLVALGFSLFTITLRYNPDTPKLLTPALSMIITAIFCTMILLYYGDSFIMPVKNIQLSLFHGVFGSVGIILYVLGAKYLPTAELVMLSLGDIVFGIFWVWVPFIGINETPERNTLIGGVFILGALILQGLKARKPHATATP